MARATATTTTRSRVPGAATPHLLQPWVACTMDRRGSGAIECPDGVIVCGGHVCPNAVELPLAYTVTRICLVPQQRPRRELLGHLARPPPMHSARQLPRPDRQLHLHPMARARRRVTERRRRDSACGACLPQPALGILFEVEGTPLGQALRRGVGHSNSSGSRRRSRGLGGGGAFATTPERVLRLRRYGSDGVSSSKSGGGTSFSVAAMHR